MEKKNKTAKYINIIIVVAIIYTHIVMFCAQIINECMNK